MTGVCSTDIPARISCEEVKERPKHNIAIHIMMLLCWRALVIPRTVREGMIGMYERTLRAQCLNLLSPTLKLGLTHPERQRHNAPQQKAQLDQPFTAATSSAICQDISDRGRLLFKMNGVLA